MRIFFDFDGTLIDSKARLYQLFKKLVSESEFSFEEYWALKRRKIDHAQILKEFYHFDKRRIDDFQKAWLSEIEGQNFLNLDHPFPGVTELLGRLSSSHSLFLVTNRQYAEQVHRQIKLFDWSLLFSYVFVTRQVREKAACILEILTPDPDDWFVGDTGEDIQQGKLLGIKTAAVLTGFRNEEVLKSYCPDLICDSVLDLPFG